MQSTDPSSSGDNHSASDNAAPDINLTATTSAQNITGINVSGTLEARDITVNIGTIITKEEQWQNNWRSLTAGSGQVQEDAAARLLDLAIDDTALAEKLKQLLEAEATSMKLKQIILRAMNVYRWLERPPKPLMQSLERLAQSPEAIRYSAANLLRNCNSLPEK